MDRQHTDAESDRSFATTLATVQRSAGSFLCPQSLSDLTSKCWKSIVDVQIRSQESPFCRFGLYVCSHMLSNHEVHSNESSYWFQVASRVDVIRRTHLGTTCPPIDFLQQSNLRSLQLTVATIRDPGGFLNKDIYSLARHAVLKLPTLVNLTLRIPADGEHWQKSPRSWSWQLVSTVPIQMLNRGLGIPCKSIYVILQFIDLHWDAATDGSKTLTWTDGEYWQSIKRYSIGLVYSRLTGCKTVNLRTQHLSGSISCARQTCFNCPTQSCLCHDIRPDPVTEGQTECCAFIAELNDEGIALAEAMMQNGT